MSSLMSKDSRRIYEQILLRAITFSLECAAAASSSLDGTAHSIKEKTETDGIYIDLNNFIDISTQMEHFTTCVESQITMQAVHRPDATLLLTIVSTCINIIFAPSTPFSDTYAELFGKALLDHILTLEANTAGPAYLSALCQVIEAHMHRSRAVLLLIAQSNAVLNTFIVWLRVILTHMHNTEHISSLLSTVLKAIRAGEVQHSRTSMSAPMSTCSYSALVRGIVGVIDESTGREINRTLTDRKEEVAALCSRFTGFITLLVDIEIHKYLSEIPDAAVRALFMLLCSVFCAGYQAHQRQAENAEDVGDERRNDALLILAVVFMHASVLVSLILTRSADCTAKRSFLKILLEPIRTSNSNSGGSTNNATDIALFIDFLNLNILRYQVYQQALHRMDTDMITLLEALRGDVASFLKTAITK